MDRPPSLVALAINNARNSSGVFGEPLPHFRNAPRPFERVGVQAVVLWVRRGDVVHELHATVPGTALEVTEFEGVQQQLGLVEPRGVSRRLTRTPPFAESCQIVLCVA